MCRKELATPSPSESGTQSPTATSAAAAFQNGVAHYKNKQYDQAIDQLTAAIDLDPGVRNYYWYRGLANTGLSLFGEAIEDYNAAIGLDPASAGGADVHSERDWL